MQKTVNLPRFLDPLAIADLQEMAKKFAELPRDEQIYIKGRMDAYKDQHKST
ncbi:MAG: hypothetical protein HFE39_07340 [Clostridiales bacterium]|nr:hypothetical protein [Clostridiales bacterium]